MVGRNKTHAAHVSGQRVDFVDVRDGLEAIFPSPQVERQKFIANFVFAHVSRRFDVHAAHPVSLLFEEVA